MKQYFNTKELSHNPEFNAFVDQVSKKMIEMDWRWYINGSEKRVPNKYEIVHEIYRVLDELYSTDGFAKTGSSSGGFSTFKNPDNTFDIYFGSNSIMKEGIHFSNKTSMETVKNTIRVIPDFPKKGIMFQDLTPVFRDPSCMKVLKEDAVKKYKNAGITKVLGIESRGFILGSIISDALGVGFVPVRKPGKLPGDVISQVYTKEYGEDTLEISTGSINETDTVLIYDDLLATGGTINAVINLCKRCNVKRFYVNCTVEITDIADRQKFPSDVEVYCPIQVKENSDYTLGVRLLLYLKEKQTGGEEYEYLCRSACDMIKKEMADPKNKWYFDNFGIMDCTFRNFILYVFGINFYDYLNEIKAI